MRPLVAEFLGTFLLVFAGTGSMVVNAVSAGAIGHLGVALSFGLAVTAGITAFAQVSGAHFNPAVTLGLALARRFAWTRVAAYAAAQCAGAIAASLCLHSLFPTDVTLGATLPAAGVRAAFWFEIVLTFILVATILGATSGGSRVVMLAPAAIGGTVALDAIFGGPVSGASMNPARSLGPALVAQVWTAHWLYWLAPILGSALAALIFSLLHPPDPKIHEEA